MLLGEETRIEVIVVVGVVVFAETRGHDSGKLDTLGSGCADYQGALRVKIALEVQLGVDDLGCRLCYIFPIFLDRRLKGPVRTLLCRLINLDHILPYICTTLKIAKRILLIIKLPKPPNMLIFMLIDGLKRSESNLILFAKSLLERMSFFGVFEGGKGEVMVNHTVRLLL